MSDQLHSKKNELKRRCPLIERLNQALQVLLFQGPMNMKEIASTIANYTNENAESIRTMLYKEYWPGGKALFEKLLDFKLVARRSDDRRYDITPFGIYFLFGECSRYYHIATIYALEKRYPYLYKHFSTLLFLCRFKKRYKIGLFETKTHRYSDGYIDIEITLRGGDLPELNVTPRLDLILRDIHKFGVNLSRSLEDLLLNINCFLGVDDFCKEKAKAEYQCLTTGKCTCVIGSMCSLLERFDKQVLEQYYGLKMDTPEAYYLFELFDDLYHNYVEDCDENVIMTFAEFLGELGVLTQSAVSREIEYYVTSISRITNILDIYTEKIMKNPFLTTLAPEEIENAEQSLKEALNYINQVKERIKQKK